jgi:acetyltransferase-like isoleucine patch superfamily enzyme
MPFKARRFLRTCISYWRSITGLERKQLNKVCPTLILDKTATIQEVQFAEYNRICKNVSLWKAQIGSHTYVAESSCILFTKIGKFCSIGPRSQIGLAQHPSRGFISTHPVFHLAIPSIHLTYADKDYYQGFAETLIGNDVWIGANVCIKGGVTIGDGAIIGAGAVVVDNIPDYSIVAGVPAKIIRFRYPLEEISILKRYEWWNKEEAWLKSNFKLFHNPEAFIQFAKSELNL